MSSAKHGIGVTSWVFHSLDIFEIAEMLGRNDLGLEVHLNDFDCEMGNPGPLTMGGVWPRTFPETKRESSGGLPRICRS